MNYFWFVLIAIGIVLGVLFLGSLLAELSKKVKNKKLKRFLQKIADFLVDNFKPTLP